MMEYPAAAFLSGSPLGTAPKKKRSLYASVFDKFVPDGGDYSDEDKDKLARQGLLNLGLTMLQTGGGFGNALGAGVQGGLLAMNQGAGDLTNDRYRKAMMARTTAGMDRNTQTEALMRETVRPDGTLDQVKFSQLAAVDPEKAKALREAVDGPKTRWQMGQVGDGAGGTIDVLFDPNDPNNIRTIDGQPIGPGAQQTQGPAGGAAPLLGDAANAVTQESPQAGLLSPEQYQADYSLLAQAVPGTQITSRQRTPERNKAVGGVANSQHLAGTAADFVVPPQGKPAFIAQAKSKGYEAIDEGDHVHLELPPQGRRLSGVPAGAPMIGRRPAKGGSRPPAPAGWQWSPDGQSQSPIPGGPADRKNNPTASDLSKAEMQMRKEVSDRIKEPRSVMTMYQKVQATAQKPSAANDLAMIFAYMKMLDPGSVVREQEFANAQNAAGIPDQVRNAYNKALRGERLNPNQRGEFLSSARQIADIASSQITQVAQEYQGSADEYGYDPRRATGLADFRGVTTAALRAPTSGAPQATSKDKTYMRGQTVIVGGKQYRVVGGDPSDPELEEVL